MRGRWGEDEEWDEGWGRDGVLRLQRAATRFSRVSRIWICFCSFRGLLASFVFKKICLWLLIFLSI